jgi:hypothetical protein
MSSSDSISEVRESHADVLKAVRVLNAITMTDEQRKQVLMVGVAIAEQVGWMRGRLEGVLSVEDALRAHIKSQADCIELLREQSNDQKEKIKALTEENEKLAAAAGTASEGARTRAQSDKKPKPPLRDRKCAACAGVFRTRFLGDEPVCTACFTKKHTVPPSGAPK